MTQDPLFVYKTTPLAEVAPLKYALTRISGFGPYSTARLLRAMDISPEASWNQTPLSKRQQLRQALDNGVFRIPLNRTNSGKGQLLDDAFKSWLISSTRQLIRCGNYRGQRHRIGKRVRGQRTRTTGRKNRQQKGFQKLKKASKKV